MTVDRSASIRRRSAATRFSATAMNARVAGERWALRRVMKAKVSYSGGSKGTPPGAAPARARDDRAVG